MESGPKDAGLQNGVVRRCRDPGNTLSDGGITTGAAAMLGETLLSQNLIELGTLLK